VEEEGGGAPAGSLMLWVLLLDVYHALRFFLLDVDVLYGSS